MSAEACYPGQPFQFPQPNYAPYEWPWGTGVTYGTSTVFMSWPITEDRIREIIREELKAALAELKGSK